MDQQNFTRFHFFRYQILPLAQGFQLNSFMQISSFEELIST